MGNEESVLLETAKTAERSGDFAAAFDVWRQLSSMTNRPEYLCKVRAVAKKLGRWADAERTFLDAVGVDKKLSIAMLLLGSISLERRDGDPETNARKAKAWLEELFAVDPSIMCLNLLGAAHDRLGEREAAKEAFRKAIDLDESYAEAYFNLGLLLADDDQNVEAEKLLRRATQLDPNSSRAHGRLGILLQKVGRSSEGEAELKRALEIDPTDATARRHLNLIAGGLGSRS
jgi:tetratricopeptide (TPR) repeat protein